MVRPPAVIVLVGIGLSGLTACGSGGKPDKSAAPAAPASAAVALQDLSAGEIVARTRAAGEQLMSTTYTVSMPGHPEGALTGTFAGDSARGCAGSYRSEGKGSAEILRAGAEVWLKPDADLVKAAPQTAPAAAAGKWLRLPADNYNNPKSFVSFCDLGMAVQKQVGLNTDGTAGRDLAKAGTRQVGGVAAVLVTMTDEDGTPVTYAIAAEGSPRVLSADSGAGRMVLTFTGFDQKVEAAAPPADQVFKG
ncbi:hypothetical protein ACIQBJ_00305 [Kitasatospora sp. NPDC088391]|uniref:hypothetical protein n=1 Tax=Kitasatospora sp. NPDC088391 TaxID=3364074 RepID=UPI0038118F51